MRNLVTIRFINDTCRRISDFHVDKPFDFFDLFLKNIQISNGHILVNFGRMNSIFVSNDCICALVSKNRINIDEFSAVLKILKF